MALPIIAPLSRETADAPALCAIGLSKYYGSVHAVEHVSLAVREGSIHGVIGPNGAGKSTLFKLLKDEISLTSGEVRLFGRRITGLGPTRTASARATS
jgi:branched-chain amino acid transport system permease protein